MLLHLSRLWHHLPARRILPFSFTCAIKSPSWPGLLLSTQYERLRSERQTIKVEMATLQEDLRKAQQAIIEDRATIAMQVRETHAKDMEASETFKGLQAERDSLNHQAGCRALLP